MRSHSHSVPEAVTPSETMTSISPASRSFSLRAKAISGRMPTGTLLASRYSVFLRLRSTVPAAPALRRETCPVKRSMHATSSVASDSSPPFASMAELIIFSVLSNPIPAFKSDCAIPAVIVPSTAARPPVPMPSLKTEIYRPLPSVNASAQSPQRDAPFAACCAKPRCTA